MHEVDIPLALDSSTFVASGPDSLVHRLDYFVIKEYPFLDSDSLHSYQNATNRVSNSLCADPIFQEGIINGESWCVQFSSIPILSVDLGSNKPRAISQFVPGPNGYNILKRNAKDATRVGIDQIENKDEACALQKLNDFITESRSNRHDFMNITNGNKLYERVMEVGGVEGWIMLSRVNTKVRMNPQKKLLHIIVTDLATHIGRLEYKS